MDRRKKLALILAVAVLMLFISRYLGLRMALNDCKTQMEDVFTRAGIYDSQVEIDLNEFNLIRGSSYNAIVYSDEFTRLRNDQKLYIINKANVIDLPLKYTEVLVLSGVIDYNDENRFHSNSNDDYLYLNSEKFYDPKDYKVEVIYDDYDSWEYIQNMSGILGVPLDKNREIDDADIVLNDFVLESFTDLVEQNQDRYSSINISYAHGRGYCLISVVPAWGAVGGGYETLVDAVTGEILASWTGE